MDIGTKDNPGRELSGEDAGDVGGGGILRDEPPPPPDDPFGEPGGQPVDYFGAVSGGEACFPPEDDEPLDPTSPDYIRRLLNTTDPGV